MALSVAMNPFMHSLNMFIFKARGHSEKRLTIFQLRKNSEYTLRKKLIYRDIMKKW